MILIRKSHVRGSRPKKGFLNFSRKVDYGFFLLTWLAVQKNNKPVTLRHASGENRLSFYFMQKVALDLRKAGIISSERGKGGGYKLAKSPARIPVLAVLEALEGPVALMTCLSDKGGIKCSREKQCTVRSGLNALNRLIVGTLSGYTLKDLIKGHESKNT